MSCSNSFTDTGDNLSEKSYFKRNAVDLQRKDVIASARILLLHGSELLPSFALQASCLTPRQNRGNSFVVAFYGRHTVYSHFRHEPSDPELVPYKESGKITAPQDFINDEQVTANF